MADSSSIQHVQFGGDIEPVKTRNNSVVYSKAHNGRPSLSEKTEPVDVEDRAAQIADEDLNSKKKQVHSLRPVSSTAKADLMRGACRLTQA